MQTPDFYWKVDESSGTTAADSVDSAQEDCDGAVLGDTDVAPVVFSDTHATNFNGSTACVAHTASATSTVKNGDWSITFWMKTGTTPGGFVSMFFMGGNSGADTGAKVYLDSSAKPGIQMVSDTNVTSTGSGLANSAWHFLAVTFTNSTKVMNLYVDNNTVAATLTAANILQNSSGIFFAENSDGAQHAVVRLDDLRVYKRKISTSEITSLAAGNLN